MQTVNTFESELLRQASMEVWQNPHDDRQFTLRPARLTKIGGEKRVVRNVVGTFPLPTVDRKYVLYEFGQSHPTLIGITTALMDWTRLDQLTEREELVCHVHVNQRLLPLKGIYIQRNYRKNLMMAVDVTVCGRLLSEAAPLYVHYYSNDWLTTSENTLLNPIRSNGDVINDLQTAANILTLRDQSTSPNKTLFHNGYLVNDLTVSEVSLGDTVLLLEDDTGRGYVDFPIADLRHFQSSRDQIGKYIVQFPEADDVERYQAEPVDEVEIWLCNAVEDVGGYSRIRGVYYSRIFERDVRMLTHRDFAIDAQRIASLIQEHQDALGGGEAPFLRIYRRRHTSTLVLGNGDHYLKDLFRLTPENRLYVMTDAPGTYDAWRADALESSQLAKWYQGEIEYLSVDALKGVYSLSDINALARTGKKIGSTYILPMIMDLGGMALCFDGNGRLIHRLTVPENMAYTAIGLPLDTEAVECIPGRCTTGGIDFDRDMDYTDQASYLDEAYYYRHLTDTEWKRGVLGQDYDIEPQTGVLQWRPQHVDAGRMKRVLKDSIYRSLMIEPEMLYHPIPIYRDGTPPTLLRLSRLDVYLNGYRCTEGIDYIVTDYPYIQIQNKQFYLDAAIGESVHVEIFHHGVPGNPGRGPYWGFIQQRYCRDTNPDVFFERRNMSFTVDGKRTTVDTLGVGESPERETNLVHREGGLYCAEHWPYSLGPWARMRLLNAPLDAELSASGAAGKLLPKTVVTGPVFIPHGHAIFSHFMKRLLVRLRDGTINIEPNELSRAHVALIMRPYIDELTQDVVHRDLNFQMLDVHPTPNIYQVDVSEEEFMFLRIVDELYTGDRIELNTYLTIEEDIPPYT